MFDKYELRGSILKSRVSTLIGSIFLVTCGLWAALFMLEAAWGVNPIAKAFVTAVEMRTLSN